MLVKCPHCGRIDKAPDEYAGRVIICPGCRKQLTAKTYVERSPAPAPQPSEGSPATFKARPLNLEHTMSRSGRSITEETIYSDRGVSVTTARIMIRGTTYAVRNITSVEMISVPPIRRGPVALMVVGILGLLILGTMLSEDAPVRVQDMLILAVVCAVTAGAGGWWAYMLKSDYYVVLSSASGEIRALTSKDPKYIERIIAAINEAIVRHVSVISDRRQDGF